MIQLPYLASESLISDDRQDHPTLMLTNSHRLAEITMAFKPIGLQDMDAVELLNRIDTKFVMTNTHLFRLLHNLRYQYQILSIDNQRIHHYRTLYYDTDKFELYHDHVTERARICKVRSREYLDTQLSFLEVKIKNQKRRTEKSRLPLPCETCDGLDEDVDEFLHGLVPFSPQELEPKLWNTFNRITLVSKRNAERLTIDLDLHFYNEHQDISLDGIVVAEIKQAVFSNESPFLVEMRRQGIRQTGFSKYCFGVSQLYETVKKNSQKEKVLMIEKLQHRGPNNVYIS